MPFFQGVHVTNYRGLASLEIPEFRDVNVIGGFNGVGKSTLLEALFMLVDQNNPTVLLRPFMWRNLPVSIDEGTRMIWTHGNVGEVASVSAITSIGKCVLSFKVEPQPLFPVLGNMFPQSPTTLAGVGVTMTCTLDGQTRSIVHLKGLSAQEMQAWPEPQSQPISMGRAVMLSRRTIDHPTELAQRYSTAVANRKKTRVLQLVQVVAPDVTEITLLQISGQPSLFASFNNNDDMLLPISMLGDGLSAILSAGLAIIDCQDGVVFLDEFDGAIHYSKLKQIWAELIKLAKEMNVQVFAATHSREAIKAISDASVISALQERLIYLRIDKVDDKTKATTYLQSELEDALSDNWEVR